MWDFECSDSLSTEMWMSDACLENIVKTGDELIVTKVLRAASGKGFVLSAMAHDDYVVNDFAFANSANGKLIAKMFENPAQANDMQIILVCQNKVRKAQLKAMSVPGAVWIAKDETTLALDFSPAPEASTPTEPTSPKAKK